MKTPRWFTLFAGLACLVALGGHGRLAAADATPPATLRVMTYNIQHGEGLDKKVDLERIAALIRSEKADLVALQEVDKGTKRTAQRDLSDELAKLTGMTRLFSNNFPFQGGEYGNALLTRFPIKRWTNTHYKMLRPGEQRGILQAVLDINGREFLFMVTHIDYRKDDSERWINLDVIEQLTKQYAGLPVILCGDFNDFPDSRVYRRLRESFEDTWALVGQGDGFTIPSNKPNRRIDYIWISKDKALVPQKIWVPVTEASDHRPVVAEFTIAPAAKP